MPEIAGLAAAGIAHLGRRRLGGLIMVPLVGLGLGIYAVLALQYLPTKLLPLAVAAPLVPAAAIVSGGLQRTLLGLVLLDLPLQFDVNLNLQTGPESFGALGGINVSLTTLAIIALYAHWGVSAAARSPSTPHLSLRGSRPVIGYVAAVALSIFVASRPDLSLNELLLLIQTLMLYVYVVCWTRTRADVRFLAVGMVAGLLLEGALVIFLGGAGVIIPGISSGVDAALAAEGGNTRFGGTIGSPNTAGSFLALLLLVAIALLIAGVTPRVRALSYGAVAVGAAALILTFSRGAWIGFGVGLLVLLVVAARRQLARTGSLRLLILPLAVAAAVFGPAIGTRLSASDNGAAQSRIPLVRIASRVIDAHPVLGVGANNYAVAFPAYVTPEFDRSFLYTVHDKYLLVWAENGIIGLVAFLVLLGVTVRRGFAAARAADPYLAPLALGLTAGVIAHAVQMFVDIFHSRPQVQLLWMASALIVAIHRIATTPQRTPA